jgi:hypothetical protein
MPIVPGAEADKTGLPDACERSGIGEHKMFGFRARAETAPDGDIGIRCAEYATPSMTASEPDQTDELLGQVWRTCGYVTGDAVSWRPWLRRQTDIEGGEMAGEGGGR